MTAVMNAFLNFKILYQIKKKIKNSIRKKCTTNNGFSYILESTIIFWGGY